MKQQWLRPLKALCVGIIGTVPERYVVNLEELTAWESHLSRKLEPNIKT